MGYYFHSHPYFPTANYLVTNMLGNINHSVAITRLEERDHSLDAEQDQCKVQLKEYQEMITKLKEENSMQKEENDMLKEKLQNVEEQLHKFMNIHTLGKILYWIYS